MGLFAARTSCHHFQSNQLRMLLASLGYVLIERLRALALVGTALATAQVDTLRIKLLKLAAVVTRNTRRIRLYLAFQLAQCRHLCARHEPAALPVNPQSAPGLRVDTKMARNPSRGGGSCVLRQAKTSTAALANLDSLCQAFSVSAKCSSRLLRGKRVKYAG